MSEIHLVCNARALVLSNFYVDVIIVDSERMQDTKTLY